MEDNKGLKILIIVLILIILMLSGFIVWDKMLNKEDSINTPTTITKAGEKVSTDNEEKASNILKVFKSIDTCSAYINWNFDDRETITFDNMTTEEKGKLIFNYIYQDDEISDDMICGKQIKIDNSKFSSASNKIFGTSVPDITIPVETSLLKIEYDNDNYLMTSLDCGGCDETGEYKVLEYKQDNNKIEIKTANYFIRLAQDNETRLIYSSKDFVCEENDLETNYDKLDQYKYTFMKNDNNYIFVSVHQIRNN